MDNSSKIDQNLFQNPSKSVYYHSLVRWNVVDEITFLADVEEHVHIREYILKSLDVVVMETVLHQLPREKHEEFMHKVTQNYHDESVLEWLEKEVAGIKDHLTHAIQTTKAEIKQLLSQL